MCHADAIDQRVAGKPLCLDAFSGDTPARDRAAKSGAQTHTARTFVTALAVLVHTPRVAKWDARGAAALRVWAGNTCTFVSSTLPFVMPLRRPACGSPRCPCETPVIIGRFWHTPPIGPHGTAIAPLLAGRQ